MLKSSLIVFAITLFLGDVMVPALSSINAPLPNALPVERATDNRVTLPTNSNAAAEERARQTEISNFRRLEFIEGNRVNQEIRQPAPEGESLSFYNRPLSAPFIPGSAEINPSEQVRLPFQDPSAVDLTNPLLSRADPVIETAPRDEPAELIDQGAVLDQNFIDQLGFQREIRQQQQQAELRELQIQTEINFIAPNLSAGVAQDADPATALDQRTVREDGFVDFGDILSRTDQTARAGIIPGADNVDERVAVFSQFTAQSSLGDRAPQEFNLNIVRQADPANFVETTRQQNAAPNLAQIGPDNPTPVFNLNRLADQESQLETGFAETAQLQNLDVAGRAPAESQTQQNLDPNFDRVQTSFTISDAVPDSSVF